MESNETGSLIEIRNVSRRYVRGIDEIHALEDVSLSIPRGHFITFMGPSGSGTPARCPMAPWGDRGRHHELER